MFGYQNKMTKALLKRGSVVLSYFQSITIYRFSGNRPRAKNSDPYWPLHHLLVAVFYGNKSSTSLDRHLRHWYVWYITKGRIPHTDIQTYSCTYFVDVHLSELAFQAIMSIFYVVEFTCHEQTRTLSNPGIFRLIFIFFLILQFIF